jgi:hypothetical protein
MKPLAPLVDRSNKVIRQVRAHPRSLLWAAAGFVGIFWIIRAYSERSRLPAASDF